MLGLNYCPWTLFIRTILALSAISGAAWLTHTISCLLDGRWGFLIAGAIAFPVGVVHGIMIWFGYGV
jgi:hypothetical protein